MTLHLALSVLASIDYPSIFIDTETVAVADIVFKDSPEYLTIRKYYLTCPVLDTFHYLTLLNLVEMKFTS
jgi:hypothetical protein